MNIFPLWKAVFALLIGTMNWQLYASFFSCHQESPALAYDFLDKVHKNINQEYFSVVKTYEEMAKLQKSNYYKKMTVEALIKETSSTTKPDWIQNAALILAAKMAASFVENTLKNMNIYLALKQGKNAIQSFPCAIPTIKHLVKHPSCNFMGKPVFNAHDSLLVIPFKKTLQIIETYEGTILEEFEFEAKIKNLFFKKMNRNKTLTLNFEKPLKTGDLTGELPLKGLENEYLYSLKPNDSKLLSSLNQTWDPEFSFEASQKETEPQKQKDFELNIPASFRTSESGILAPLNKNITETTNTTLFNDVVIPYPPHNSLSKKPSKSPLDFSTQREYSFDVPISYEPYYTIETDPDLGYSTIKELISNESILGPLAWRKIKESMPGTACQATLSPGYCLGAMTTKNETMIFNLHRQLKALYFFLVELLKNRINKEDVLIIPSQGWGRKAFLKLDKKIQEQLIKALNVYCPRPVFQK